MEICLDQQNIFLSAHSVTPFDIVTQICDHVRNDGWSVVKDPEDRVGPYASKRNQWVSYDDVSNVARKVRVNKLFKSNVNGEKKGLSESAYELYSAIN